MHNGGFEKIGNNAEVFSDFGKEMGDFNRREEKSLEKIDEFVKKQDTPTEVPILPPKEEAASVAVEEKRDFDKNDVFDEVKRVVDENKDDPFVLNEEIEKISKEVRGK